VRAWIRTALWWGGGLEASLTPNTMLVLGYDGQFGSKYKDHSGNVQVHVRF